MPATAIQIRRVTVEELLETGQDLFAEHWRETGEPGLPLDIDELRYRAVEQAGNLICLGVYVDGWLEGYAVVLHGTCVKSVGSSYAQVDSVYVTPGMRRQGCGRALLDEIREAAAELGAGHIRWCAKIGTDLDRILAQSSRCRAAETHYVEELE